MTTPFAEELKEDESFLNVQVTGHSLGGGLAMITGSQAGIPAVGKFIDGSCAVSGCHAISILPLPAY